MRAPDPSRTAQLAALALCVILIALAIGALAIFNPLQGPPLRDQVSFMPADGEGPPAATTP